MYWYSNQTCAVTGSEIVFNMIALIVVQPCLTLIVTIIAPDIPFQSFVQRLPPHRSLPRLNSFCVSK